ncbi:restriction endonuclease subunit S [Methylolobus aquaticus]|nr:restriction endonuclease subunit S [Methylolobus aquaticus]
MSATAKPPRIDIRPDHWVIVRDILHKHVPQYEVWAFGSRATWTAKDYSDLDLAVITDRPLSISVSAALADDLSESDLPWKVDVVDWATTSESFRKIIERDKVVVQEGQYRRGMAGNFNIATFDDLIRRGVLAIGDGYRAKLEELGGSGPIFLRAGLVSDTHITFDGAERFHVHRASKVASKMSKAGDVVVTTKGNSTGRVAYVDDSMPPFVYSPHLSYWRSLDPSVLSPGYLRYWSRGEQFQRQLRGLSTSTDMAPYLSLVDQKRLTISLPAPEEQCCIAHVLGTLDDKIELNRRMNETLEAIARAIFKSWFVDFDPVRAKASGEPPESICRHLRLTPDLLALFPDRLVDSELGEIPQGWRWSSIGQEVSILGGGTPSTGNPEFWNGEYAWVTPKDLSGATARVLIGSDRKITQAGVKKISSGQLQIGTVLLSSRAPIGYLALTMIPVSVNQGFIAMVCDKRLPNTYVLQWAIEHLDAIKQRGSGTTFAEISKTNFRPMAVLVPGKHVLKAFHQYVMPLYDQITARVHESETLGAVRDTLLPKLLSGELPVGRDIAASESP